MRIRPARLIVATAIILAAASAYKDYYASQAAGHGAPVVGGTGARLLDPWLRNTPEGQRLVLLRFDRNGNGEIGVARAGEANRWFRRFADRDGDLKLTDDEIRRGLREVDRRMRVR